MSHDYVTNSIGARIDIGWTQFIMDSGIVRSMPDYRDRQSFWVEYCRRYRGKHGAPFRPDTLESF